MGIYVCIVCIYVRTSICVCVCTCMLMRIHIHACIYTYIQLFWIGTSDVSGTIALHYDKLIFVMEEIFEMFNLIKKRTRNA